MIILSIIIPIYNVALFVKKCILSCVNQDIPQSDYEIIVVNDGSTDNSLAIVNEVSRGLSNIHVFSQSNAGLSAARNKGMLEAKGEYYMFVDSDDWIAENCLGKLCRKLMDESPDALAICAADVINGENYRRQSYIDETPVMGRELLRRGVSPCAPFAIWSADFLKKNKLAFYEGIYHEDSELTPRAYYLAEKVSFTNDIVYFVYQNPNSITRSVIPKKSFDIVNVVCPHLSEFSNSVKKEDQVVFDNMISTYINNALSYIINTDKKNYQMLNTALFKHRELFKHLKKASLLKYQIEALLFCIFPKRYVEIYIFLKNCSRK